MRKYKDVTPWIVFWMVIMCDLTESMYSHSNWRDFFNQAIIHYFACPRLDCLQVVMSLFADIVIAKK